MREIANFPVCRGGNDASELLKDWLPAVGVGARRSVKVPNRIRATVEVIATIETCVAAEVGMRRGSKIGGYNVPMIVPRLVMNVSPGPAYSSACE